MLRLVWQFQRERDVAVDLILVTGDLGVWPDVTRLDSSTRKHAQDEPAELGFLCFEPIVPNADHVLALAQQKHIRRARDLLERILPEIDAKVVFVGGNHEDYEYLNACRSAAETQDTPPTSAPWLPVEKSGLIWWLPPEHVCHFAGISITGLSGIDPESSGRNSGRYHETSVLTEDSVMASTLQLLDKSRAEQVDVLLTHDGLPGVAKPGKGTPLLLDPILALNPRYHFFGHYHSETEPIVYSEWLPTIAAAYPEWAGLREQFQSLRTVGIHVNKLAFKRGTDTLRRHVLCHMMCDAGNLECEFVEDLWLREITPVRQYHV